MGQPWKILHFLWLNCVCWTSKKEVCLCVCVACKLVKSWWHSRNSLIYQFSLTTFKYNSHHTHIERGSWPHVKHFRFPHSPQRNNWDAQTTNYSWMGQLMVAARLESWLLWPGLVGLRPQCLAQSAWFPSEEKPKIEQRERERENSAKTCWSTSVFKSFTSLSLTTFYLFWPHTLWLPQTGSGSGPGPGSASFDCINSSNLTNNFPTGFQLFYK